DDLAGVRLLLARDHLEQRRLAGAVGADDADDGAVGDDQREIVDQQPVAEALADVAELDDVVAQALARRNEDLVGLLPLLVLDRLQLLQAGQARLALGTAALGVLPGPFQLALNGLLAGLLLVLFLPEALVLLLEPLGVVALPGNAAAAVQLEDPLGGVVEEVAVMGDGHHRARVALQELLQPFHRFGVEVVGGLVQQQHVRLGEQQAAQGDAALLAAGEVGDLRVPRRQAQGVGGDFQLLLEGVGVAGGEDGFQAFLFLGQGVEVCAFLGVGGVDLVQARLRLQDLAHAFLDRLAHGVLGVELGFLRQVADLDARLRAGLALEVGVDAGHDPQHGGLAGAVQAQQADLGAGEEGQGDVLDDLLLRRDRLGHAVHGVDVLHRGLSAVAGASRARPVRGWGRAAGAQPVRESEGGALSPSLRGAARRPVPRPAAVHGVLPADRRPSAPARPARRGFSAGPQRGFRHGRAGQGHRGTPRPAAAGGAASWPQMAAGATLSGLNPHRKPHMFAKDLQIAGYDPELAQAIADERRRQEDHVELIASENYASPRVLEAQGSVLTNKYA